METAMLPEERSAAADDGAPVEEAEATRTTKHLFQYSAYVHAPEGAEECEHATDGECKDGDHFHAWVCLPNSLQHRDILEKARAAKARRKRALKDAGGEGRQPSDAYVTLESELDDELEPENREALLDELAGRATRKRLSEIIREVQEGEERFETYFQDAEEWRRLTALEKDERPADEYKVLDELMTDFEEASSEAVRTETERERKALEALNEENLRAVLRDARITLNSGEAHLNAYYTWLGFVGTRKVGGKPGVGSLRYFGTIEEFKAASPEAINAVDDALKDLESRMQRGDASGNS